MNNVDKQYLNLLNKILITGVEKDTRAGKVKSIFGEQLKFDLKEGFPLLTTKKVFYKGIIHELLWFLSGNTNIKYLVDNNVNIWNDDAYRHYCSIVDRHNETVDYAINNNLYARNKLKKVSKEQFIENVKNEITLDVVVDTRAYIMSDTPNVWTYDYKFGDLGPVYGKQWRSFGFTRKDQIAEIIKKLKNSPNDRRMICVAYNPDEIDSMALPPCHVMFQFYTRELSQKERMKIFNDRYMKGQIPNKWHEWFKEQSKNTPENMDIIMPDDGSDYDLAEIPKYGLSCMYTMRSNDEFLGQPYNTPSYALLTCMIAKLLNMVPDELIASIGDCHIYEDHFNAVKEQLSRNGSDIIPKLIIHGSQKDIEDFKYEDFEIVDYYPDAPIKAPLLVGM